MSFAVEHLSPRDSLFARFDPRWKLAAILIAVAACIVMRSPVVLAIACGLSLAMARIARLPGAWCRKRLAAVLIALLPFLLILPLTVDRGDSFQILGLRLSEAGFVAAAGIMFKALAILTLMLVLLGSSPFYNTLHAAQRLGAPGLFVMLTCLSYRYLFLLLDELQRLRVALRLRGFRNRVNRHSYRTIGQVTGTLLVRGSERAERVAQAMRCRGFDGRFRVMDEFRTTGRDVVMFSGIVALYVGLVICEWV